MNFDLEKPFSLSTAPASFKFLEEELLCTSETNFIIIFNLLKFFSVTRQSYVLRISALDLLSNRIPETTSSQTVRWLRIPGKHKPIWWSLYLEIIIKKKVHQSINQWKYNQIMRENLVWLGRFILQKKV